MRIRKLLVINALLCTSQLVLVGCTNTYTTPTVAVHGFNPAEKQPNGATPTFACSSDGECSTRPYCGSSDGKCIAGLCSYQAMGTGSGYTCECFVGQEDFCPYSKTQLGISKCKYVSDKVTNVVPCASPSTVP